MLELLGLGALPFAGDLVNTTPSPTEPTSPNDYRFADEHFPVAPDFHDDILPGEPRTVAADAGPIRGDWLAPMASSEWHKVGMDSDEGMVWDRIVLSLGLNESSPPLSLGTPPTESGPPSPTVGSSPPPAANPPGQNGDPESPPTTPPVVPPVVPPPTPTGPPVANNDAYTIVHDRPLLVEAPGVLANDTDPAGAPMRVLFLSSPTNGTIQHQSMDISNSGDGSFYYLPNPLFVGTDSFTYKVTNGVYTSNTATVTITVTNQVPQIQGKLYSMGEGQRLSVKNPGPYMTFAESGWDNDSKVASVDYVGPYFGPGPGYAAVKQVVGSVLSTGTDGDSDILRAVLQTDVQNGDLAFYPDGTFVYTPNSNFVGNDSFTFYATDGLVDTPAVTTTLVVTPSYGIDIDGKDSSSDGNWMREIDEMDFGLGVSTLTSGEVLVRAPRNPDQQSGWVLENRKVYFDPTTLVVGGSTTGEIDLFGVTGDVTLSVVALHDIDDTHPPITSLNNALSVIHYEASWHLAPGSGPLGQVAAQLIQMRVGPKVGIEKVDFTQDHGKMLDNTREPLSTRGTKVFPAIEVDSVKGRNNPSSHTSGTQLKQDVYAFSSGIPTGGVVDINGNGALNWTTPTRNIAANNEGWYDANLGVIPEHLGRFLLKMKWTATVTVGQRVLNLPVANFDHSVYMTRNVPKLPDGTDAHKPTEYRMRIAARVLYKAYTVAHDKRFAAGYNDLIPNSQQLVYEILQQHQFNLKNSVAGLGAAYGWKVPEYWTNPFPKPPIPQAKWEVGTDCISGAIFTRLASYVFGLNGIIDHKEYTAKGTDEVNAGIAVEYTADFPRYVDANNTEYSTALFDGGGGSNRFESCVVVTLNGTTWYFPSGAGKRVFTKKDDVLTVFASLSPSISFAGSGEVVQDTRFVPYKKYTLDEAVASPWAKLYKP
ncbi:MAG: cadherin-like domain-containing protein [Gemmataceae bacterium]